MGVVFDRPVRDVAVRAGTPYNCGGFARILADLEPAQRFEFVDAHDDAWTGACDDELVGLCVAAVSRGVREELAAVHEGELAPVRFVLRRIVVHPVDSTELRNRAAGRMAVAEAVRRLHELP